MIHGLTNSPYQLQQPIHCFQLEIIPKQFQRERELSKLTGISWPNNHITDMQAKNNSR